MKLGIDQDVSGRFKSVSQKARVLSESWVAANMYCPACSAACLRQLPSNRAAADFACSACHEEFEVKSSSRFGARIVNGAYSALLRRMAEDNNPNLVLLRSDEARTVVLDLEVIPRRFFTPAMIEARSPLRPTARRAGWVGCTIHLDRFPSVGRISIIADQHIRPEAEVRADWSKIAPLLGPQLDRRTWLASVLRLVEGFGPEEFTLDDVYRHEGSLQPLFPGNRNIRAKIRQQLQQLRDAGLLAFLGRGRYRLSTQDASPDVVSRGH